MTQDISTDIGQSGAHVGLGKSLAWARVFPVEALLEMIDIGLLAVIHLRGRRVDMQVSVVPDKVIGRLGEEAAKQLYDDMVRQIAQSAATKVDRADYDAHSALINEKFERFRIEVLARLEKSDTETDRKIANARLSIILWTVGLIATITGGWSALIISLLR